MKLNESITANKEVIKLQRRRVSASANNVRVQLANCVRLPPPPLSPPLLLTKFDADLFHQHLNVMAMIFIFLYINAGSSIHTLLALIYMATVFIILLKAVNYVFYVFITLSACLPANLAAKLNSQHGFG